MPNACFHYIVSEHGFEHITYDEGQAMLRECYRILIPGGTIRIATPNLLRFVELFNNDRTDEQQQYIQNKLNWHDWEKSCTECAILNYQLNSWGHRFVYDPKTLKMAFEKAGFQDIKEFSAGDSDIPELRAVEARDLSSTRCIREANAYETLIMQATRPSENRTIAHLPRSICSDTFVQMQE